MNNFLCKLITIVGATLLAATLLMATSAGCKNETAKNEMPDNRIYGQKFLGPDEARDVFRASDGQRCSGARADATLYPFHFDKGALNSTGQVKLDHMLDDDDSINPMVVYVNVPQDDLWNARVESITAHCKDRAVDPNQIKVVRGENAGNLHPASPGVEALKADQALGAAAVGTSSGAPGGSQAGSTMK